MFARSFAILCLCSASAIALAADQSTTIYALSDDGVGDPIGSITLSDSKGGLTLRTRLAGLPPGSHGIHIHQNGDCGAMVKDGKSVAGLSAGGHFDPKSAGKHLGPTGDGHKGDLPLLTVKGNGKAVEKLLAPHLTLADVRGHAIIIHLGGDNYSDDPKPLGGGGARIACGVIE